MVVYGAALYPGGCCAVTQTKDMSGLTRILVAATIFILHRRTDAVCPCNRVVVSGADTSLQVNGVYYLMDGVTCDDELVFKSEELANNRYIFADSRDQVWAMGPKECSRANKDQYVRSQRRTGTWPILCPIDVPATTWEEYLNNKFKANTAIKIQREPPDNLPQTTNGDLCPTYEFNLTGAAAALDVNGQYMINIYEDEPICDVNFRYVWKRVFPATPVRYVYWDERDTRWAASDKPCHNDGKRQYLVNYGAADMWEETVVWEEQTTKGQDNSYRVNKGIKFECLTPECKQWSTPTYRTPRVCVRQKCMTKPGATEALCHAPCGGCGKESQNRTCEVGLRQPGGIWGTVETLIVRCNIIPCNGGVFSQKYEFIKFKFNAYGRWARAYMLRKCCCKFPSGAVLPKRRYCSNVGGLV